MHNSLRTELQMTEWKTVYCKGKTNRGQSALAQRVRQGCNSRPPPSTPTQGSGETALSKFRETRNCYKIILNFVKLGENFAKHKLNNFPYCLLKDFSLRHSNATYTVDEDNKATVLFHSVIYNSMSLRYYSFEPVKGLGFAQQFGFGMLPNFRHLKHFLCAILEYGRAGSFYSVMQTMVPTPAWRKQNQGCCNCYHADFELCWRIRIISSNTLSSFVSFQLYIH